MLLVNCVSNLKFLYICIRKNRRHVEDDGFLIAPDVCPNLKVLELGEHFISTHLHGFPMPRKWPDNVYSPHNCFIIKFFYYDPSIIKKDYSRVTGIHLSGNSRSSESFWTLLKNGWFPCLRVLICDLPSSTLFDLPPSALRMASSLSTNCPDLQFLQIDVLDLYVDCHADWHGLLKRLFVLIVHCFDLPRLISETGLFPLGCELRVLTIAHSGPFRDIPLFLKELLRIKNMRLPKLEWLNVIMTPREHLPSESEWLDNLKRQFRQKSIVLSFFLYLKRQCWQKLTVLSFSFTS